MNITTGQFRLASLILLQPHLVLEHLKSLANIFLLIRIDCAGAARVALLAAEHFAHILVVLLLVGRLVHNFVLLDYGVERGG